MKAREFSPRRLDVRPFAESGEPIGGQEPLVSFERLLDLRHPEAAGDRLPAVQWSAQGELRAQRGAAPQVWLHLTGATRLSLQCQRCLDAVEVPVAFDRWFLFVDNERLAAELDEEIDEDVLVLGRQFDLLGLVEDELLLAAPIVPRHETCPTEVVLSVGDWTDEPPEPSAPAQAPSPSPSTPSGDKPHPFAVLASLRKTPTQD